MIKNNPLADEQWLSEQLQDFRAGLSSEGALSATRIAMNAANALLTQRPAQEARVFLWTHFFAQLAAKYGAHFYQAFDFEFIDYELWSIGDELELLRGPAVRRPDSLLKRGDRHVTLIGAAQMFGRFNARAPHARIARQVRLPVVNLASGGAGPDYFLNPRLVEIANRGRLVVLQVLSARSVSTEDHPGLHGVTTSSAGQTKKRLNVLRDLREQSPAKAKQLIREWQELYVERMVELIDAIDRPTVLVWISARRPNEWSIDLLDAEPNFGLFPQLVEPWMLAAITPTLRSLSRSPATTRPHARSKIDLMEATAQFSGWTERSAGGALPTTHPKG